ncbi:MAG: hypothetical protein HY321_16515 [Armatimonadetes bacterium]|nr:hypothetical protein [Armatimonadota bacterium]
MAGHRKRTMGIIAAVALAAAGVLMATAPRGKTRFVSVRRPAPGTARAANGERDVPARAATGAGVAVGGSAAAAAGPSGKAVAAPAAGLAPAARVSVAAAAADGDSAPGAAAGPRPPRGTAADRNLFRPLVTTAGLVGDLPPASLPPWPTGFDGLVPFAEPASPMDRRQRAYWEYTGTVELDGVAYALIQEKKTKAGAYVRVGDVFRGGTVENIHPQHVVLSLAGRQYTLPKSSGLTDESVQSAASPSPAAAPVARATAQPAAAPPPSQALPASDGRAEAPPDEMGAPREVGEANPQGEREDRRLSWRRRRER